MSLKIYKGSKIYVACPSGYKSGGPELLHQLCFNLKRHLGIESEMLYFPKKLNPVHPEYASYNLPYTFQAEDDQKNILIVSEVAEALSLLPKYKNIRKGIWFMSVDFYYFSKVRKTHTFFLSRMLNWILKQFNKLPLFDVFSSQNLNKLIKKYDYHRDKLLLLADFYMSNTYRAIKWFNDLKPMYYLSEYLHPEFLQTKVDLSQKENIVVYNPQKGISFTRKIISLARSIKFIPIFNMTRSEVIKTLKKAKVYIDFGNHPGKDRLPREAAILGCCVITGKRGSAAFFEDVPIPEGYKFEDKEENIPKIIAKIKDCFENFEERYKDFEYYRKIIKEEPQRFVEDLKKIFIKVV